MQAELQQQLQDITASLATAAGSAEGVETELASAVQQADNLAGLLNDLSQQLSSQLHQHGAAEQQAPHGLCTAAQTSLASLSSFLHRARDGTHNLQQICSSHHHNRRGSGVAPASLREEQMLSELSAARDVFKVVEREVSLLQQQAMHAAAQLHASEKETDSARLALQDAIKQLQALAQSKTKGVEDACVAVQDVSDFGA
jgi:chromosome segregation ATPase